MRFLNLLAQIISSKKITQTLLNILVVLLIVLLVMATSDLWLGLLNISWFIAKPFIIAFIIAFIFNPVIDKLHEVTKNRALSVLIVYVAIISIIILLIALAIPMLYESIAEIYPAFVSGLTEITIFVNTHFNFDISSAVGEIRTIVSGWFEAATVVDTTFSVLNTIIGQVGNAVIYIVLAIYMSATYDKIKIKTKQLAYRIEPFLPIYLKEIDLSLIAYVKAFALGALAQAITTCIMYLLIGHNNWLLLGIFSGISSIIPYVGPIAANVLGLVTSLSMGPTTIVLLCVLIFVQSTLISYVIQPKIYSSQIDMSILAVLFGILTGSTLLGPIGMIIAMPFIVTVKIIYKVYRNHNPITEI